LTAAVNTAQARERSVESASVLTTDYELSQADGIEHFLVEAYGTSMRIGRDDENRPLLRHRRADAGSFAVETAYQAADLSFLVEPLNKIVVTRTVTSRLERVSGGSDRRFDAGDLFLMSYPHLPYTARWMPGEIQNCLIDPTVLAQVAASAPGRRPEPIGFTGLDPVSPALASQWWATRTLVVGLLAAPVPDTSVLVLSSAAHLLASVTLAAFPNTAFTDPTIEDRHDAHPATLRRAIGFIDGNAQRDISMADIAEAANVTIRAVQLTFRRHLDMTPMAYLRRVRLDRAHDDLRDGNPAATTVTAVAYRWGFPSSSRFAASYRRTYGIPPSDTLRGN
jgi:AraC-like DNA-binding protein